MAEACDNLLSSNIMLPIKSMSRAQVHEHFLIAAAAAAAAAQVGAVHRMCLACVRNLSRNFVQMIIPHRHNCDDHKSPNDELCVYVPSHYNCRLVCRGEILQIS